jgi:hypothetical protein
VKRYILAHWRGQLSLALSFLVNGVLGYIVLLTVLIGGSHATHSKAFDYAGIGVFAAWLIWALVGILRCVVRLLREPHSALQRALAVLVAAVVAIVLYDMVGDLRLLLRASV